MAVVVLLLPVSAALQAGTAYPGGVTVQAGLHLLLLLLLVVVVVGLVVLCTAHIAAAVQDRMQAVSRPCCSP
jgi:uncharacterized membrane protein